MLALMESHLASSKLFHFKCFLYIQQDSRHLQKPDWEKLAETRQFGIFNPHSESDVHPQAFENVCQPGFPVVLHTGYGHYFHKSIYLPKVTAALVGGDRSPYLDILSGNISSSRTTGSQMLQCPRAHTAPLSQ